MNRFTVNSWTDGLLNVLAETPAIGSSQTRFGLTGQEVSVCLHDWLAGRDLPFGDHEPAVMRRKEAVNAARAEVDRRMADRTRLVWGIANTMPCNITTMLADAMLPGADYGAIREIKAVVRRKIAAALLDEDATFDGITVDEIVG